MRRPETLRSALLAAVIMLAACGKKEEEAAAPPPPPPPPKQEVKVESLAEIMQRLSIDPRVKMDDSERPSTGDAAGDLKRLEATLLFFNAMVKADATALRPMLDPADQSTLDLMLKDGQWKRATEGIDRVTVGCAGGSEPDTFLVLATYMIGDHFDTQLWSVKSPAGGEQNVFAAQPSGPRMAEQLKGTKAEARIQQWLKMIKAYDDVAKQPDEKVLASQQDRSIEGDTSDASEPSSPAPGGSPSKPGRGKGGGGPQVPGPKGPGGAPGGPG